MVGHEAEELRKKSFEEAKEITEKATAEKEKLLRQAKAEAETILQASHAEVQRRLDELTTRKEELERIIENLQQEESQKKSTIYDLLLKEEQHRAELLGLEETIKQTEENLKILIHQSEEERKQLELDRERFRNEYEEFKFNERKLRATMETEALEAKVRALQVQAEAAGIQEQVERLRPQIDQLKSEKARYEETLSQLKRKIEEQERVLSHLSDEANRLRSEGRKVQGEIEERRLELARLESEKNLRMEEAQASLFKAQQDFQKSKELHRLELEKIEQKKNDLHLSIEEETKILKKKYQADFDQLLAEKVRLADELARKREDADKNCELLIDEATHRKEIIEGEIQELHQERENLILKTKEEQDRLISHAREEAARIIRSAEESASEILSRERTVFKEEQNKIRRETEELVESARLSAGEILEKARSEARALKTEQEQLLAQQKQVELLRIRELKAQGEEEIIKRKHDHAKSVATNVFALVASEMYKARGKLLEDHLIEEFSKGIKDLVVDTMLDRVGPDDDKLQSILKTSEDAKNKERVYWQRIKITAFGCAFALMTLIAFPQILTYPRNKIVAAFTEKSDNGSEEFLTKVKEARVQAVYQPKTTPEFKQSYVDNVLFTTDYLAKTQDTHYQDKWILELNDFFIKTLDVKDTTIIKFVSLESALLKDLSKMKQAADPKNPDPKITEMRSREQDYRKKLAEIFEDPEKVSRFYRYHEKFYKEYYHPRRPASN